MNKLESIKEAFKERGHVNFGYDFENEDVEKLLQRLERYERALKEIALGRIEGDYSDVKHFAREALNDEIT